MRVFEVLKPGLFTTIQDLGRNGHLRHGVPVSGAMDQFSLVAANCLVENDPNDACLETTLFGPELRAIAETQLAVTGGSCSPMINGREIKMWQTQTVAKGDTLSFEKMHTGCRAYISIRMGIDVPKLLGSRSTYARAGLGGLEGRPLRSGDLIESFHSLSLKAKWQIPKDRVPRFTESVKARVVLGPQAEMFTRKGVNTLLSSSYFITSEADRMGYRLDGPTIEHECKAEIVSDALLPGAIQVPKSGKPILLMRDAQTTGGYPKIAVVITPDVSRLGQAKPNDSVEFRQITSEEALQELKEYGMLLRNLPRLHASD